MVGDIIIVDREVVVVVFPWVNGDEVNSCLMCLLVPIQGIEGIGFENEAFRDSMGQGNVIYGVRTSSSSLVLTAISPSNDRNNNDRRGLKQCAVTKPYSTSLRAGLITSPFNRGLEHPPVYRKAIAVLKGLYLQLHTQAHD